VDVSLVSDYLKMMIALLALTNPLGAVPVYIALTESQTSVERRRTARIAGFSMMLILLITMLVGAVVLLFFGITVASFRVGGGILVLILAIGMMQSRVSASRPGDDAATIAAERDSFAVVPLSLPLLSGPGSISAVILYADRNQTLLQHLALAAAIATVSLIAYLALRAAPWLSDRLGRTGINIVTRVMGLILAAIAIEFIAAGLKDLFPVLR
jgi:multiple antibiotic resistance protein